MFKRKRRKQFKDILKYGQPPKPPEMQWRSIFWNWNTIEGYYNPIFGRCVIPFISFTLYLGIVAIRFRYNKAMPKRIFIQKHPIYFEKWVSK